MAIIPPLLTAEYRRGFVWALFLRTVFVTLLIFALHEFVTLGTNPLALGIASALGIVLASRFAFSRLTTLGFGFVLAAILCFGWLLLVFGRETMVSLAPGDLAAYNLETHLWFLLLTGLFVAAASWGFWRSRHWVTGEFIVLVMIGIELFANYREFRFSAPLTTPQLLDGLAWWLRVDYLTALILLGIGLTAITCAYAYVATSPLRPVPALRSDRGQRNPEIVGGKRSRGRGMMMLGLFALLSIGIAKLIYAYYLPLAQARTANGVGQAAGEGMSPLSFQSALGNTNQPAGLVRLEGDYQDNPFSPMLYLRESALSLYNGRELVQAGSRLDRDICRNLPSETCSAEVDPMLPGRVSLKHSMYLLADHKTTFAIDYPISIKPLKNPEPHRFKAAFRAESLVPAFSLESIRYEKVGDPRWDEETKKHYLVQHPDPRYGDLARSLVGNLTYPVEQAATIVNYLSKTAVYTLTPNHEVKPDDDPVASFLFGDLRGYCVHFSHASVYMFRALGIPARIGTGYLTDLSQAKDGHILLRMSDRHAWAEIYVNGRGWIPFDTQPEQVENHGDSPVDMQLLEDLMSKLDPGEEILPKDIAKDEAGVEESPWSARIEITYLWWAIGILVTIVLLVKIVLRFGWIFPARSDVRYRRAYRAISTTLFDLGHERAEGETRTEFATRMERLFLKPILSISEPVIQSTYGPNLLPWNPTYVRHDRRALAAVPKWQRIKCILSLRAVAAVLFGEGVR